MLSTRTAPKTQATLAALLALVVCAILTAGQAMPSGFYFANYPILPGGQTAPGDDAPALVRMRLLPLWSQTSRAEAFRGFPMQVYYGGPTVMRAGAAMKPFLGVWAMQNGYTAAIETVPITPNGWANLVWPFTDFRWWLAAEGAAEPRYRLDSGDGVNYRWVRASPQQQHGLWVAGNLDQVGADVVKLLPFPGLGNRSDSFKRRLVEIANELEGDPNHLLAVMQLESGIDPTATNSTSKATGLIQFMPSTAKNLGTTVDALRAMSGTQQLEYVRRYYLPFKGQLTSPGQFYMATFMPAHLDKPTSYVLASAGSPNYDQNKSLDTDKDGQITVGEVTAKAENIYRKYLGMPPIAVPEGVNGIPIALGVLAMAGGIFWATLAGK